MKGKLTFAVDAEERDKIWADTGAMPVSSIADIPAMSDHLLAGGEAVAVMSQINIGYRLPEGVEVAFTESCPKEGADRMQAQAREHPGRGIKLRPHQLAAIEAVRNMPADELARRLQGMGLRLPTQEPIRNPDAGAISGVIEGAGVEAPELPTGFMQNSTSRVHRPGQKTPLVHVVDLGNIADLEDRIGRKLDEKMGDRPEIVLADEAHHIKDPFRHAKPVEELKPDEDAPEEHGL